MNNNVKYSLKFKILLSVSFLLLACTAFNLLYSYKLFIDDKTSYIYESSLKRAENISDQIKYRIDSIKSRTQFNSLLFSSQGFSLEKIINEQKDYIIVGTGEIKDGNPQVLDYKFNDKNYNRIFNRYSLKEKNYIDEVTRHYLKLPENGRNQLILVSPKGNLPLAISYYRSDDKTQFFFNIIDLSDLFDLFTSDDLYTNQIILLNNKRAANENSFILEKLNYKNAKKGTVTVSVDDKEKLLSYVFTTQVVLVTTLIDKDKAFGITEFLIIKTVLFGAFLLGFAIMFGIYFSASITLPIKKLTAKAKQVAEGNFSEEVHINTTDEIHLLANTFNWMSTEINDLLKAKEEMILKLEDYSHNLEKMVEQRTAELKQANDFMALMVNSLNQGLVVFDRDLNIHPMYTKACEPIFGQEPKDKTLLQLLNKVDESEQANIKQWAMVSFNELIPFESAKELGPRQIISGTDYKDPDYKFIQLDYYPMRDQEEKVGNIVLVATDKTVEIKAIEKARENDQRVSMILKILNNKTQFQSFMTEVQEIFDQFENVYDTKTDTVQLDLAMMLFHTLNGGFGLYSITKLQTLARSFESEISTLKNDNPNGHQFYEKLKSNIELLKSELEAFKVEIDHLIGTKFSSGITSIEIDKDKIEILRTLVDQTNNEELKTQFYDMLVKEPVINFFKAYDDLCKTIAFKTGKEFKGISFQNQNLKVNPENLEEFFNVLVHLFRNCMDHGIEDAFTRKNLGKSPDGHLDVVFETTEGKDGTFLNLVIKDDGSGINPQKIREKYSKLYPDVDLSQVSDREIIYKIFDPFFSTRDEVSAFSGRGVGMSAIKEVVEKLHGQIEVETEVGKGSTFSFVIPLAS